MKVKGKMTHQSLGTGFWGIEADNGQKFQPLSVPSQFQKEGLRIEAEVEKSDMMSPFMWGTPVEVKQMKES